MPQLKKVSVVKTAQMANTLKLVLGGQVVGSVVETGEGVAELRDARDRQMGTYADAQTAIAEFEKSISFEEIGLDL